MLIGLIIIYLKMEGNVLFNDALNTFYLWLCGVRHMVKNHCKSMLIIVSTCYRFNNYFFEDSRRKEGNVLINDALNTFYLWLYGRREMFYLTTHSTHFNYGYMGREREMFYLTTHSTHFIYGYMVSDIW